ncbi:probable serine/threonine-protein kinase clkA [Littorina saxatilis]|uniref:probable serine/threonine-protein kinase clkA n=1 Tax=Littorina saxatilis TaxID=31220 RepID=UPI0038B5FBA8
MICEMQKTSKQTGLEREGIDCASCVTTPAPITTTTLPPTTTIPPTTCPTIEELSGIAGFCYFDQGELERGLFDVSSDAGHHDRDLLHGWTSDDRPRNQSKPGRGAVSLCGCGHHASSGRRIRQSSQDWGLSANNRNSDAPCYNYTKARDHYSSNAYNNHHTNNNNHYTSTNYNNDNDNTSTNYHNNDCNGNNY